MADIHIHAPLVIAAGAILPPVCISLVALRFYARRHQSAKFGLDDWLTLPGLVTVVGSCIAILVGAAEHSTGYKTPPLPPGKNILTTSSREQTVTRSILWATEIMQVPGLTALKMSFIFFYRRIFLQGSTRPFQILTIFMLCLISAWGSSFFFSLLFICPGHPDAFWTMLKLEKEYCLNTTLWHNTYGISDVVLDLMVILFPLPQVVQLQMSTSRKLAVLGVFSLGAFSILASILRMVTYLQSTKVEFEPGTDTDILITGAIYWAVVESGIALISCCLPTVHNFTKRKISQNRSRSASNPSYYKHSTFRRSMLRRHGYQEERSERSSDDTVELTDVGDAGATSRAKAGGLPARNDSTDDEHILVARTVEAYETPEAEVRRAESVV